MTQRKPYIGVLAGMALILFCHIVYAVIVLFLPFLLTWLDPSLSSDPYFPLVVWIYGIISIGLLQLLYVVPFYIFFRRRRKLNIAKGVVITAGITLLLNGGCFLVTFT